MKDPLHMGVKAIIACIFVVNSQLVMLHKIDSYYSTQSNYEAPDGPSEKSRKFAVAGFIDRMDQMYGTYSIMKQMQKFNMSHEADLVAVVPSSFSLLHRKEWVILNQWLDKENIYEVPTSYILKRIQDKDVWKGVFNKLWLFNLTDYDKVIVLDQDVLIRTNIMHWFDYPTPCATQAKDNIEWNSGAMVITPNTDVFNKMMDMLPNMTKNNPDKLSDVDNWNSGHGQQGFLSAFFTDESNGKTATSEGRMKTMPTEASILSSSLNQKQVGYFAKFRMHIFETVHFTTAKPWLGNLAPKSALLCNILREWTESVEGIDKYGLSIDNDYFRNCPQKQTLSGY